MEHGVNKTAEYLSANPNGLVPTINDDGYLLWESQAVMRYLARRGSPKIQSEPLYPSELTFRIKKSTNAILFLCLTIVKK